MAASERSNRSAPLSLAAVVMAGAVYAAGPAEIELVRDGKHQQLPDAARARIAERLPQLFQTCSVNSRDHPKIFASADVGTRWQGTQAKDHLLVRFATPIDVGHPHQPRISARQVLLGLDDARYPGPHLSRNGESVVAHGKCSGGEIIKFVCVAEIKPVMPGSYHALCSLLDQAGREAPAK